MRTTKIVLTTAVLLAGCRAQTETDAPGGAPGFDLGGCDRTAVIDDSEDNDHRVLDHQGRGGYVYTFLDEAGSTVEPLAGRLGGTFAQGEGGANGSMYAAHFEGKLAGGEIVYAGFGINFLDPKKPYDASRYEGIAFHARRAPESVESMRVKVPDTATDEDAGKCTECFNDFGSDIELTEDWQEYRLPFSDLTQLPGWGSPRPGMVDTEAVYGIQFQINASGSDFDVWVDDITFFGCKE